jgi:hypothetical protein
MMLPDTASGLSALRRTMAQTRKSSEPRRSIWHAPTLMLAVALHAQSPGAGKFEEAERLASEIATMFPGAIDDSGAPLESLMEGIRLLKDR